MTLRELWLGLLTCATFTGCVKGDAQAQGASLGSAYQRPLSWSSECFGRLVLDVPGRLQFGEATRAFYEQDGRRVELYASGGSAQSAFGGDVALATVLLTESGPLVSKTEFDVVVRQANFQYEKGWRINRTIDASEIAETKRRTEKVGRPGNRSFLWRQKSNFDFGILVESDMRVRLFRGELSGDGSSGQAKAVVEALWSRYRPRQPGEMPSIPGICTPYGFLADPPKVTERDYGMAFSIPDPRHSNLVLGLSVTTLSNRTIDPREKLAALKPEDMPTPWQEDQARAREEKAKCRPQQGTASRDLFGCMFAGMTNIKSHREVEYLTLSNGQRARLLVMEYRRITANDPEYEVRLEAPGEPNSATRPSISISATGMSERAEYPGMTGKEPPSVDEAVKTVRTIAASLRLRPGAIAEGAVVKDTLEGVR